MDVGIRTLSEDQVIGRFEVVQDGAVIQTGTVLRAGDGWFAPDVTVPIGAIFRIILRGVNEPMVTWFNLSPGATVEIGMEDSP